MNPIYDLPHPLPKDYWSPPKERSGREGQSADRTHLAVGRALSAWGQLEEALAELAVVLATGHQGRSGDTPLMLAWGAVEGVPPRIEITRLLLNRYEKRYQCPPTFKTRINKFLDGVKDAARIRNDIAHGIVSNTHIGASSGMPVDVGAFLTAPGFASFKNLQYGGWTDSFPWTNSRAVYIATDIEEFGMKFTRMMIAIMKLGNDVASHAKAYLAAVTDPVEREILERNL